MGFLTAPLDIALSAAFESKPDVPQFHWTDLVQNQLDTTAGNLQTLPQAEKLGAGVNEFMRGERAKTLAGIPGLSDIESETAGNLKSWLRGELPSDVVSSISRAANAKAFAGGYGGGGGPYATMKQNLTARDIGATSADFALRATPLANQYAANEYAMRAVPEFNPASMFMDPLSTARLNIGQQAQQWNRDWLANRIAAQPEPWQQTLMTDVGGLDAYLGTGGAAAGGQYLGSLGSGLGGYNPGVEGNINTGGLPGGTIQGATEGSGEGIATAAGGGGSY